MSKVVIDYEQLAYGLEEGISHTDTIFAYLPYQYRLRASPCGLVSSGIHEYAKKEGLPSRLLISTPNIPVDLEMQHVVVGIGEEDTDLTLIDGSYSQFLGYVGLTETYEEASGKSAFPEEKVIDFLVSEREFVFDWLSEVASLFQVRSVACLGRYTRTEGVGPLSGSSREELRKTFSAIWDPKNMKIWTAPERVEAHGQILSEHIPKGTIESVN
jgi:hypothetical protein